MKGALPSINAVLRDRVDKLKFGADYKEVVAAVKQRAIRELGDHISTVDDRSEHRQGRLSAFVDIYKMLWNEELF